MWPVAWIAIGVVLSIVLSMFARRRTAYLGRGRMERRFTAFQREPFVVFLIGTRLMSWWQVLRHPLSTLGYLALARKTFLTATVASTPGLLGVSMFGGLTDLLFGAGTVTIQYWRSHDELLAFSQRGAQHVASRGHYFSSVDPSNAWCIWHELYTVAPGSYECVYGNAKRFGLAAATGSLIVDVAADPSLKTGIARMARGAEMTSRE